MIPDRNLIWTQRGYTHINYVSPGDQTISYNPERNCMEYDEISSIETDYYQGGLLGIKSIGLNCLYTPDHPILFTNIKTRELKRKPIRDIYMEKSRGDEQVLTPKPFEPYLRNQKDDELEWTARMAATSARHKRPPIYNDEIWKCLKDITAEEAQIWLNTFFHWNILQSKLHHMKTIFMHNQFVLNMVYHTAPRAGVSTYWGPHKTRRGIYRSALSICTEKDIRLYTPEQWRADRQDGTIYNISTKNGNFLGKYLGGTLISACKYA